MKRVFLFLLVAGASVTGLVMYGGGLEGPQSGRPDPVVRETTARPGTGPKIDMPEADITGITGITQPAPPRAIVWHDRLSDERIEIATFTAWRFRAKDAKPLRTMDDEKQGVLCHDVVFLLYREPRTRGEALALARNEDGAYDALLHQSFTAKEARVSGRLGEVLARRRPGQEERSLGDTLLRLSKNVVIIDRDQGLDIRGEDVRVWPEQEHAKGIGAFTLVHEALTLRGNGLDMQRDKAKGWGRITITKDTLLQIKAAGRDKNGKPIFDFGPGDFRPTNISSDRGAVFVRQESRRETALTITFKNGLTAVQEGGRSLEAGRAELVAVQKGAPALRKKSRWELQHFHAGKHVELAYPGRTSKGAEYLTSASADRLVHDVHAEGPAVTQLLGDIQIVLRGQIPLLAPSGRMILTCRDRASIGPLLAGTATGGLDPEKLQLISLRGLASIERDAAGPQREHDVLEADAIDLVVRPDESEPGTDGAAIAESRMTAVHFAALGNVRIGGTRIRGATHRLIADDLHTERPHITAEGAGTRFEFPELGSRQRLLGPDTGKSASDESGAVGEATPASGRWVLNRLLARGDVDISTSLGGPAVGIPTHLTGDEVSYDRISRRARLMATGPAPARIAWGASRTQTNSVETRELMLDRSAGRITAKGAVRGELYVARKGGRQAALPMPAKFSGDRLRGGALSVATDERIDIRILRSGTSTTPQAGQEQVIRIAGPVTTELRSAERVVDRMRSASLEVALVFLPPADAAPTVSAPNARAAASGPRTRESAPLPPPGTLDRFDVRAGAVRIDLKDGDVSRVEGTGGVDLKSRDGHVRGDRITYEDATGRVDVHGTRRHPAVALLGATDQRSEVQAERLALQIVDGAPSRLEAHAPTGQTSDVHLYRDVPAKPGHVEWFKVTYEGAVVITHSELTAGRVMVVRRLRKGRAAAWSAPSILRAPTLRVTGQRLLSTQAGERKILRIIAQGRAGTTQRHNEAHFQSGAGRNLVQVWGHRFDFDVVKSRAELTGTPQRDVTMKKGAGLHSSYTNVTIDMETNLPVYISGSRILWRPPQNRKPPAMPKPQEDR